MPELKKAFIRTLGLSEDKIADPENSHLFAALGAAMDNTDTPAISVSELAARLKNGIELESEIKRLEPLFATRKEYDDFCARHQNAVVKKSDLEKYKGKCFLGIDAGSTTTKLALTGEEGELLFSYYTNNQGSPVKAAKKAVRALAEKLPDTAEIVRSCSTGYGEGLLKEAFSLDEGEVETVAHCTAAKFFDGDADCVLDIGGQDMKCITLHGGAVDNVLLNEACSSGCGSFIENFANSLGYGVAEFSEKAIFAESPVDLGTRCTVFMNSNVKQAQKEGASVSDISAGLAYSVIKNALFKVIKLADAAELGRHIVVQGGTFLNKAVLRAFEKIAGTCAVCPDIAGIMGAFGAALLAKESYNGQKTSMLPLEDIINLEYKTSAARCGGCQNNCMLTINTFSGGRRFVTGNRCERGDKSSENHEKGENIFKYKRERIFGYEPLPPENAPRGVIGIPRVLNMYENYPFWATFFKKLGFSVALSPYSTRQIYELGMESIPSESECYPAKLSHGHVEWLIKNGIKTIFHPCVFYERRETEGAQNHFNCPIVVSYPENLKNNVESVSRGDVRYIRPFMAFTNKKITTQRLSKLCRQEWGISPRETKKAVSAAWAEQLRAKEDIRKRGREMLSDMEKRGGTGIVLAGRPYHADPEINHGIPELVASFGLNVFTEDSLTPDFVPERPLRVNDQWVYHSRLYTAAEFVGRRDDMELIQLNSFGCGLDAVTTDQVSEILEKANKLCTVLKIDEVNNLGAARIRIRSLIAAINMRRARGITHKDAEQKYSRAEFTKKMFKDGYTILAPQMSPIHFNILEPVFGKYGYRLEILSNDNRSAIDTGLKFVNNDACFPSITVVGQIMNAVLSGKYDTKRLAVMMSQTGGCCRASNYVGFIRRALRKAGFAEIPVISLNLNGMEKNSGFKLSPRLLYDALRGVVYGDLLMRCLYRVRPYELYENSANELHKRWEKIAIESLTAKKKKYTYREVCRAVTEAFDALPLKEDVKKPRVGIVGEILVKYMPLANNRLVELLEKEGAEAVVPDLMDFLNYCMFNLEYKHEFLGSGIQVKWLSRIAVKAIYLIRRPALSALAASKRFSAPMKIRDVAELAKPFLSIGNQYGEGWFLTGEMAELLTEGVKNIVCIQPFACLPNHVVGKGVIKALRKKYPEANIAAVDYDPGASEVNQLNRIKLMFSAAQNEILSQNTEVKKDKNAEKAAY